MKSLRLIFLAAACALPAVALAQWQWVDKDGRKVFSDQPPPPDVPAANILKQPGVRGTSGAAAAPAAAPVAAAQPAVPKLSGKDKALEDKKKQAEAAEAEKKKAQEEEMHAQRQDNCNRARQAKAQYDSGVRIARMNSKGEREFVDDAQRASETKRLEGVIARDCKQPAQ